MKSRDRLIKIEDNIYYKKDHTSNGILIYKCLDHACAKKSKVRTKDFIEILLKEIKRLNELIDSNK